MRTRTRPPLPEKLSHAGSGVLYTESIRFEGCTESATVAQTAPDFGEVVAVEIARRWNAHATLLEFVERFQTVRNPNVRWTAEEKRRSLADLDTRARALLMVYGGGA